MKDLKKRSVMLVKEVMTALCALCCFACFLVAAPVFALETYTNSIGMEFVLIPAGTFQMGCSSWGEDCTDNEKPRHEVEISRPFYLGKYEVTQAQWEAVMGNNLSRYKGAKYPVENVSWEDVKEFIGKLNEREGHNRYRLPTEAEWEYAARAKSTTAYCFGNDKDQLKDYACYGRKDGTCPVGKGKPNDWGLHDMHGNVWEWVEDWDGAYGDGFERDPEGPRAGEYRVRRGGSWLSGAGRCRSAGRGDGTPGRRDFSCGFRLALSPGH